MFTNLKVLRLTKTIKEKVVTRNLDLIYHTISNDLIDIRASDIIILHFLLHISFKSPI